MSWKSKILPDEIIEPPSTYINYLKLFLNYVGTRIRVEIQGTCLKEDKTYI